jgi:hypothetical protein
MADVLDEEPRQRISPVARYQRPPIIERRRISWPEWGVIALAWAVIVGNVIRYLVTHHL